MIPQEVITEDDELELPGGGEEPASDQPAQEQPRQQPTVDYEDLKRELREQREASESLRRELAEQREAQKFWASRGSGGADKKPTQEPEDWLAAIEKDGIKVLEGHFARPEDVEQRVSAVVEQRLRQQQQSDAEKDLRSSYPDLFVPGSELRTHAEALLETTLKPFTQSPELRAHALGLAAKMAKEKVEQGAKARQERAGGAGAHRPMRGGGGGSGAAKVTSLTPDQREVASKMGISAKDMLASINGGND